MTSPPIHDAGTDQAAARIAARYPAPGRRRLALPLTLALALLLGAWIVWAGLHRANPGIVGQLQGYQVVSSTQVDVTITVHRPDPQVPGLCVVQAESTSGEVVGEVRVVVAPGTQPDTTHRATVKTYLKATTAVLTQCFKV